MLLQIILTEIIVILTLIGINGALAMAELAIVSARKSRLQQMAAEGNGGASVALELAADPSRFLASVQIGITLTGILAGAFGGATIAEEIAAALSGVPVLAPYGDAIGLAIVVISVTFLSLILGELVPKRIALARAETVATVMARPLRMVAIFAGPAVKLLSFATEALLRLMRVPRSAEASVTEEEVKILVDQGTQAGAFNAEEGTMIKRALAFSDLKVAELMTRRRQMIAIDLNQPDAGNFARIIAAPHAYFPAYDESPDRITGILSHKRILERMTENGSSAVPLRDCLIEPQFVCETMGVLRLLEKFRQSGQHFAVVVDEYGATAGLVTLTDMMTAIVGGMPPGEADVPGVTQRDDGSLLIDGAYSLRELLELLGRQDASRDEGILTTGGFAMQYLGHVPTTGESFTWQGFRVEIVDMDGHRVDKLLFSFLPGTEPATVET